MGSTTCQNPSEDKGTERFQCSATPSQGVGLRCQAFVLWIRIAFRLLQEAPYMIMAELADCVIGMFVV